MKTLQDVKKFVKDHHQYRSLFDSIVLGGQSLNMTFRRIPECLTGIAPDIRIFAKRPVSYHSKITSVTLTVGKSRLQEENRNETCRQYFGCNFQELAARLRDDFGCKPPKVCQIKCAKHKYYDSLIIYLMDRFMESQGSLAPTGESAPLIENETKTKNTQEIPHPDGTDNLFESLDSELISKQRNRIMRQIEARSGQSDFRRQLLRNYDYKCAVTNASVREVLEAAHIIPYSESFLDISQNGILLRSDLHTLFDNGLITIDDDYKIIVHHSIRSTSYGRCHGRQIRLPADPALRPSKKALSWHRKNVYRQPHKT